MKDIKNILIVVLLGFIIYLKQCSSPKIVTDTKEVIRVETKYDTITNTKEVYIPKYTEIPVYIHDTIREIDTVRVVGDYFKKRFYLDTLNNDSNLIVIVADTVTQNRITSRKFTYQLIDKETIITKDSSVNKNEFFWGLDMAGTKRQLNFIGAGVMMETKKDDIYGVGLGINQDLQPVINLKFYRKFGYLNR